VNNAAVAAAPFAARRSKWPFTKGSTTLLCLSLNGAHTDRGRSRTRAKLETPLLNAHNSGSSSLRPASAGQIDPQALTAPFHNLESCVTSLPHRNCQRSVSDDFGQLSYDRIYTGGSLRFIRRKSLLRVRRFDHSPTLHQRAIEPGCFLLRCVCRLQQLVLQRITGRLPLPTRVWLCIMRPIQCFGY